MALIKWENGDCRIIKLEVGDIYANGYEKEQLITTEEYILLDGHVKLEIASRNETNDYVYTGVSYNAESDNSPIVLRGHRPDPYEWRGYIIRHSGVYKTTPSIKEIEHVLGQSQPSIMDMPMYSVKDLIIFGANIAIGVFFGLRL